MPRLSTVKRSIAAIHVYLSVLPLILLVLIQTENGVNFTACQIPEPTHVCLTPPHVQPTSSHVCPFFSSSLYNLYNLSEPFDTSLKGRGLLDWFNVSTQFYIFYANSTFHVNLSLLAGEPLLRVFAITTRYDTGHVKGIFSMFHFDIDTLYVPLVLEPKPTGVGFPVVMRPTMFLYDFLPVGLWISEQIRSHSPQWDKFQQRNLTMELGWNLGRDMGRDFGWVLGWEFTLDLGWDLFDWVYMFQWILRGTAHLYFISTVLHVVSCIALFVALHVFMVVVLIVTTHTMSRYYAVFHAVHVAFISLLCLYTFLSVLCPFVHSSWLVLLSPSFHPHISPSLTSHHAASVRSLSAGCHRLTGLYSYFLSSLSTLGQSLSPIRRSTTSSHCHHQHRHTSPFFLLRQRSSFFLFFCLLLSGDIQLNPGPDTITSLSFSSLNIRSACSMTDDLDKPTALRDFILDNSLDILTLTETWLTSDTPHTALQSLTPPTYTITHSPRLTGRGGGLAIIYRSHMKIESVPLPCYSSFEVSSSRLTASSSSLTLLTVYRPPSGSLSLFIEEFSNLLSDTSAQPGDLLISGDFNIHLDNTSSSYTKTFLAILDSCGLVQHVSFPTHVDGHTLDLIISRSSSNLVSSVCHTFPALSDHHAILATLSISHHSRPTRITKSVRSLRSINSTLFSQDILTSTLFTAPAQNLTDYLTQFSTVLTSLLDKHAPLKNISCPSRPNQPFFTRELRTLKSERSKLESVYRKAKTPENWQNFKEKAKEFSKRLTAAKRDYYHNLISKHSHSPRKLWSTLNNLLNRASSTTLPSSPSQTELASTFLHFFRDKITKLRCSFKDPTPIHIPPPTPPPVLSSFGTVSQEEVRNAILQSSDSTCTLDFIPTRLLKSCLDALLPPITTLFNLCISENTFPAQFKHALVTPLIKKPSLPKDDLSSYRPISNLSFLSKLLERVILNRLMAHLQSFPSLSPLQSAYRKFHSVETALLRIHNDLLSSIDRKHISALVLLDLSAAFDTVDHDILLSRLNQYFGLTDSALSLLKSYLQGRTQAVVVGSSASASSLLSTGVPQGSVLGPLLFTLYTTPLTQLLHDSNVSFHLYADDTQLYISFSSTDSLTHLTRMSQVLDSIHRWLSSNYLALNPSKTEFILVGTSHQRAKVTSDTITFSSHTISPSESARNLGVVFDRDLSLTKHLSSICRSSYFTIRQLRQVRSSLDRKSAILLANALVTSKLDHCNSLYYGLPQTSIRRLQLVQNSLARAVYPSVKRSDHITPVLRALHWLPIQQRIVYKLSLLTFKTLQHGSPSYLAELLTPHNSCRNLRSSDKHLLSIPFLTSSAGRRSFSFAAPTVWNSLPFHLRSTTSLATFRASLKTHLFPP